jgi:hypothetical protein
MRIHLDNTGVEIDPPSPIAPCQSLSERMGESAPEPVVAGPLSPAFKAILEESEGLDRREFNFCVESGLGFAVAFQRAAVASPSSSLTKNASGEIRDEVDADADGAWHTEYDAVTGAFLRCWRDEGHGRPDFEALHKSADHQNADALLNEYRSSPHARGSLEVSLSPLVERACAFLSPENGELLRKALKSLDLSLLSFFFEKAFCS